jgi:DNA-directed RNA polymerase specialized sigma24 family protein
VGPPDDEKPARYGFTDWENAKIEVITRRFPDVPVVEMESQLRFRLLVLKLRPRRNIPHWKAYRAEALRNEALNFAGKWRKRRQKELSPTQLEGVEDEIAERQESFFGAEMPDLDRRIAFRAAWAKLPQELREFWLLLDQVGGNLTRASERMGIHRNTGRLWEGRIREVLREHGLE